MESDGFHRSGAKPNVFKVPCPDTFRGPHRGADAGERYAATVDAR